MNPFRIFRTIGAAEILLCLSLAFALPAYSQESRVLRYDLGNAADALVQELAEGSQSARRTLERLGPPAQEALQAIGSGSDFQYSGFSARTQIETLYNLAEAEGAGEGNRFLAVLHREVSKSSAIARLDPDLQAISRQYSPADLAQPLKFADPKSVTPTFLLKPPTPEVEKAIDLLSEYTAPNRIGSMARLMERHLRLDGRNSRSARQVINESITTSSNRKAALRAIISAHTPPPKVEQALQSLLKAMAGGDKAIRLSPEFVDVMRSLSAEPLPPTLSAYEQAENQLESRIGQRTATARKHRPTVSQPRQGSAVLDVALAATNEDTSGPSANVNSVKSQPDYRQQRADHAAYSKETLVPSSVSSGSGGGGGGGGGGGPDIISRKGPAPDVRPAVPRTYRLAIRSSRAARGIAIGAPVSLPDVAPIGAYWIPSDESPRFGAIVVSLPAPNGNVRLAASRFLFTDSFEAAVSTLWDEHGPEAKFREGEISILMSLNPDSRIGQDQRSVLESEVERKLESFQAKAQQISDGDPEALFKLLIEYEVFQTEVSEKMAKLPRGIVIHPALYGKELAWSVARVDFWFNDISRISEESQLTNGGVPLPPDLAERFSAIADTWQFYERENAVSVVSGSGNADKLEVKSRDLGTPSPYVSPNHFAVSLFSFSEERPSPNAERDEDGVWRLIGEEREVQSLLDWIFTNHHDFLRLNDYSEALSLLRWIYESKVDLVVLDADGPEEPIEVPDRIFLLDIGPFAGQR